LDTWGRIAPTRKVPISDAESLDICPRVARVKDQRSE
jgi:hypothetical protein